MRGPSPNSVATRQAMTLETLATGGFAGPALLDLRLREEASATPRRSYPAAPIRKAWSPPDDGKRVWHVVLAAACKRLTS